MMDLETLITIVVLLVFFASLFLVSIVLELTKKSVVKLADNQRKVSVNKKNNFVLK